MTHPTARRAGSRWLHGRTALLLAFAFSVMADPVSSVAYAIEAALRALDGNLALLLPAMSAVVLVVGLVVASYHQLVARFPEGGGSAAAAGRAFGEGFSFVPMGALVVDFVLTIAISVSAGSAAIIAYLPSLAPHRVLLALALLLVVAGLMWFGHLGRAVFALLTLIFIGAAVAVLLPMLGVTEAPTAPVTGLTHSAPLAVALAFPVAMALATGIEAPSSAIAQLGQLDDDGRRSFGRWALWLTLGIVGTLTLAITGAVVWLGLEVPHEDTTLVAELARAIGSPAVFAAFQGATALLLLSAASSSFQAGPGLLKALARSEGGSARHGVLPAVLGRANVHHVPVVGVLVFLVISACVVAIAGASEQRLVLFYAVAVFVSFLMGLIAMATFAWRERRPGWVVLNGVAALAVAFTLVANMTRPAAVGSLAATLVVAGGLYWAWVRAGRPRGAANAVAESEAAETHGDEQVHGQVAPPAGVETR
ncbi:amino acid permease [Demequina lignilytica]|uniref:Amino acid permease n=1 Tax=Demequina lignilytica TaxID=3051663 RepID=A0AB35MG01_9MICO|nr:amino acid permease [Demequina sp. SYSU T0a273]MDN4482677.1 amino acid permease [Demequina sp. SYSU T0a273]